MIHMCPHRECTASYHLEEADEGKTFRCEKCGSLLLFEGGALTIISAPATADEPPQPSIALEKGERSAMSPSTNQQSILAVIGSWFLALMFALGSFLVILFFFLPLIDNASIARQQAVIDAGDRKQNRLDDQMWNRNTRRPREPFMDRDRDRFMIDRGFKDKDFPRDFDNRDKDGPQPPNEAAQKKRKDERAEWDKAARQLDDALEETRMSTRGRMYVYTWGMLFGFVILGLASVGFLSFGPTTSRRIFGGVVISVEMLLIFTAYFVHYTSLRFMPF